jgi:predicted DNA-binding protein YlxM (UPF0122 family)
MDISKKMLPGKIFTCELVPGNVTLHYLSNIYSLNNLSKSTAVFAAISDYLVNGLALNEIFSKHTVSRLNFNNRLDTLTEQNNLVIEFIQLNQKLVKGHASEKAVRLLYELCNGDTGSPLFQALEDYFCNDLSLDDVSKTYSVSNSTLTTNVNKLIETGYIINKLNDEFCLSLSFKFEQGNVPELYIRLIHQLISGTEKSPMFAAVCDHLCKGLSENDIVSKHSIIKGNFAYRLKTIKEASDLIRRIISSNLVLEQGKVSKEQLELVHQLLKGSTQNAMYSAVSDFLCDGLLQKDIVKKYEVTQGNLSRRIKRLKQAEKTIDDMRQFHQLSPAL